jgi:hypothetical protein
MNIKAVVDDLRIPSYRLRYTISLNTFSRIDGNSIEIQSMYVLKVAVWDCLDSILDKIRYWFLH